MFFSEEIEPLEERLYARSVCKERVYTKESILRVHIKKHSVTLNKRATTTKIQQDLF